MLYCELASFFAFFLILSKKTQSDQRNGEATTRTQPVSPIKNSFKWRLFPSRCKSRIQTAKGNRAIYGKANAGTQSNEYKSAENKSMP